MSGVIVKAVVRSSFKINDPEPDAENNMNNYEDVIFGL